MYISAYLLLVASFLCAVFVAGVIVVQLATGRDTVLVWAENTQKLITALMTVSSIILLYAFLNCDFSVEYVAQYSDSTLPLFYRMTAFWAGQAGSMLFWAWSVALGGIIFVLMPGYKRLTVETRMWFWVFFFAIMAFFLLVLTAWSNPFVTLSPAPLDGRGLNPLLQNPGMIFHPPLLFLGYGGFVVPGCLALAQTLSGNLPVFSRESLQKEASWGEVSRAFVLVAWLLLTSGIVLGGWWAYMELGWGGYWAWDPVENASLIPWLVASAYLHTAVIESRRGKLHRVNVFLMALTTISAFFATYLVRSGVVESLHAFGDGGVGTPLLIFTLASLFIAVIIPATLPNPAGKTLGELQSKEGLLTLVAWLLLALSFIILIATMWPVIINALKGLAPYLPESLGAKLPQKPMGLEPAFYNRTCLPLFALLSVLLVFCPYRKWKEGFLQPKKFLLVLGFAVLAAAGLWMAEIRHPVALLAAACALAGMVGIVLLFASNTSLLSIRSTLAAHGVHIGLLMMVLGVAFSGPYQVKQNMLLGRQESKQIGEYQITLNELYEGESQIGPNNKPNYRFLEAELLVTKNGQFHGKLAPQRRLYTNFENQTYAEVGTLFSLGNEIYATLLSVDDQNRANLAVNINPLVNWLWIGGILMCLFPFLGLAPVKRVTDDDKNPASPAVRV